MWPILACSVISVAIIIERAYVFYWARVDISLNLARLLQDRALTDGNAPSPSPALPGALADLAAIACSGHGSQDHEHRLARAASAILRGLEKNLRGLAIIGSVTPIIGLLGTVTGMIGAFMAIESQGDADVMVLAGGIWEALITTAAGLAVAIPTQIAFHYYEGRADDMAKELHDACHAILDRESEKKPGGGTEWN